MRNAIQKEKYNIKTKLYCIQLVNFIINCKLKLFIILLAKIEIISNTFIVFSCNGVHNNELMSQMKLSY